MAFLKPTTPERAPEEGAPRPVRRSVRRVITDDDSDGEVVAMEDVASASSGHRDVEAAAKTLPRVASDVSLKRLSVRLVKENVPPSQDEVEASPLPGRRPWSSALSLNNEDTDDQASLISEVSVTSASGLATPTARRKRGRPATTGAWERKKAELAMRQAEDALRLNEEMADPKRPRNVTRAAPALKQAEEYAREYRLCPSRDISAQALDEANRVYNIADVSKNLRGTETRQLRMAAHQLNAAITVLAGRSNEDRDSREEELEELRQELRSLKYRNEQLSKEVERMREEIKEMRSVSGHTSLPSALTTEKSAPQSPQKRVTRAASSRGEEPRARRPRPPPPPSYMETETEEMEVQALPQKPDPRPKGRGDMPPLGRPPNPLPQGARERALLSPPVGCSPLFQPSWRKG